MSRIGRKPIPVPGGVKIDLTGNVLSVSGPKGSLTRELHGEMIIRHEDGVLQVDRPSDSREHRSLHGLTRTLVSNMVEGVTNGFRKEMELIGVGYRAQMQGPRLVMALGYSHPIECDPPAGISYEVVGNNRVAVVGIDKEQVGQEAANLRKWREPEPYKGKGLRYIGEVVFRKAGKAGAKGGR